MYCTCIYTVWSECFFFNLSLSLFPLSCPLSPSLAEPWRSMICACDLFDMHQFLFFLARLNFHPCCRGRGLQCRVTVFSAKGGGCILPAALSSKTLVATGHAKALPAMAFNDTGQFLAVPWLSHSPVILSAVGICGTCRQLFELRCLDVSSARAGWKRRWKWPLWPFREHLRWIHTDTTDNRAKRDNDVDGYWDSWDGT